MRRSSKRPMSSHQVVARQIRALFDESLRVEQDATTEPGCIRNSAGHDENVAYVAHVDFSGAIVAPSDTLKMLLPFERDNLRALSQINRRIFLDPSNQIAEHDRAQSIRAHQHVDAFGCLREERGRLTCGISTANDDHFFIAAQL